MRILVGNHIDGSIRVGTNMSAAVQRILWFAHDGDLIVLPAAPDSEYLAHVTGYTGVDPSTLRFHTAPPGEHGSSLLDPLSLLDPAFLASVRADLTVEVSEVFPLWPSAGVARFAIALGLADRLPGYAFTVQGGGEPANSKAHFRALAAAAGVPIAAGTVCRSRAEAEQALTELLECTGGAVVKQAHNGSGNGNRLVFTGTALPAGHVGARHLSVLRHSLRAVQDFWAEHWAWATADNRFPVVIEEFVPDAVSVYTEYRITDCSVTRTGAGILDYADRVLSKQVVPLRPADLGATTYRNLIAGGEQLAEVWRAFGYRGYLSADAVVDQVGRVTFTEVNAQVSGSPHLYEVIAGQLVRASDPPERVVAEYEVPADWGVSSVAEFVAGARRAGCAYDRASRTGALVSTAPLRVAGRSTEFMYCIAYGTSGERDEICERLACVFTHASAH